MKKEIRRSLPIRTTYKVIKLYRCEEGLRCAHCHKKVLNYGVLENPEGVQFKVGMDCVITLADEFKCVVNEDEFKKWYHQFITTQRFVSDYKKAVAVYDGIHILRVKFYNYQGKEKNAGILKSTLDKFGFKLKPYDNRRTTGN